MPQIGEWLEGRGFLLVRVILAPIAVIVAFVSAGFGHGSYVWARIVLPLACLPIATGNEHLGGLFLIVPPAVLEYPLYGYWLDRTSRRLVTCCVIIALHAALVAWLFFGNTDFRYYNKY